MTARRRTFGYLYAALAATGLAVGVWAFFTDAAGFQTLACKAMHDRCAESGWGGVGSPAQDAAWTAAGRRDDGEPLRAYLARWPNGAYAGRAKARLAQCRAVSTEVWRPDVRPLPLAVGMGPQPFGTEEAARADALERAQRDAVDVCAAMRLEQTFRLTAATPEPAGWRCQPGPAGTSCGFAGRVNCSIEISQTVAREVCRP